MSKINIFRVVNLNYNNNANRIEDETFHFGGDNTLLSLQNGGGKTVLVQMLIAPFVHRRYRNTTDRTFQSFFTTSKPTFLLIEWVLDGGAGYVLTGMMVRKSQGDTEANEKDDLDIITFIHEYKVENEYDIQSFPLIEKDGRQKKLKGFQSCRKLFEEMRMKLGSKFQAFDLSQSIQQKQYFVRLKEYGINSEEWENIIKKINLKESGLSELFKEAKDEVGLVEKWFLPAIETKLNKDENRIKQFHTILNKFIWQYKENEVKIDRKATIMDFRQDSVNIKEKVEICMQSRAKKSEKQEQLAWLRHCIEELLKEKKIRERESQNLINNLESDLLQTRYEEASFEIYKLMEELEKNVDESDSIFSQKENFEAAQHENEKRLYSEQCAKIYEEYQSEEKNVLQLENMCDVQKKKEEELMPERNELGYNLRLAYSEILEKLQKDRTEVIDELEKMKKEQGILRLRENELELKQSKFRENLGSAKADINKYNDEELVFNEKYPLKLERNILGYYENALFEILLKKQENNLNEIQHEYLVTASNKQKSEEEREVIQRNIQDCNRVIGEISGVQKNIDEKSEKYSNELEKRLRFMKYLSIAQEKQFEREYLCSRFDEKIDDLREVLKKMEREKEKYELEFEKMKHGVVLEIPKEVEQLLHSLDLNYVTGMEYMKQNGYDKSQNDELLNKVPLLPYSVIMSERELKRLMKAEVNFYTSYPVPILVKEELGRFSLRDNAPVYHESKLNFFVVFNEGLLDEKELEELLKKKELQIHSVKENISKKIDEIKFYDSMRQEIAYQECDLYNYKELQKEKEKVNEKKEYEDKRLIQYRIDKTDNDEQIEVLSKKYQALERDIKLRNDMQVDIIGMQNKYLQYVSDIKKVERLNSELKDVSIETEQCKDRIRNIYELFNEKTQQLNQKNEDIRKASDKNNKYAPFREGSKINKDLVDMEARYEVITENMSHDTKLLETQLNLAQDNFTKCEKKLMEFSAKYNVDEKIYKEIRYSSFREKELEKQIEADKKNVKILEKQWNEIDKRIAVINSRIVDRKEELKSKLGYEELVSKERIIDIEFSVRVKLIRFSIQEEEKNRKSLENQRVGYEANLSALSEFSDLVYVKEYDFHEEMEKYNKKSLNELNRKEIEELYGSLIRDFRKFKDELAKHRMALEREIDRLILIEKYKDDFYRQPLALMRQLTEKPEDLSKQLALTLQSYQTLLEKLEVDIAFIDREKEKINEMIFEYVLEIHKNLDKIDRNSTINVKGRTIKMLKIQVPSWEENKEIYMQRMNSFTNELISSGIKNISDNKNLEEMIGVRVTSKSLYDSVVGIGTTVIKLYKIEAQREYPITWANVSKNSGGEGFLSAFVVLVSLLSYMRRDESDLFIEREEGKVLVMDNPFAQTNASHLLIPLMNIAKKCNTQLICLTGLGGESIYNRFDNIYVMNLIESSLQRDIQYLKADHVKGDAKVYQMSASRMQIEDSEQMELIF